MRATDWAMFIGGWSAIIIFVLGSLFERLKERRKLKKLKGDS